MTPVAAGTAIGAATLTVGRGALSAVGNGLSFLAQLATATSGAESVNPAKQADGALAAIKQQIDQLRERIQRQLAAAGIRLSERVDLTADELGGIAVAGGHPQQAAIQAALSSDVLLERDFAELAREHREVAEHDGSATLSQTLTLSIPQTP